MPKAHLNPRLMALSICRAMKIHSRGVQMPSGLWLKKSLPEVCSLPALLFYYELCLGGQFWECYWIFIKRKIYNSGPEMLLLVNNSGI